ncbi:TRAP transporter small permease [bacterium]|nr:TRAP transporter small permease [bacterium]
MALTDANHHRLGKIGRIFEVCCGYLLLVAVALSLVEIVARVVFRTSFDLFFSFTVWISIWSLLLITGLLLPTGEHLSIDFLRNKIRGGPRWLLEVILALITLGYGIFITWGSILFIGQLYQRKSVFATYIAIPKWQVELCVPIGMLIFTVFAARGLIRVIRTRW